MLKMNYQYSVYEQATDSSPTRRSSDLTGSGNGTVTSDRGYISCTPYCSDTYDSPKQVTLRATADKYFLQDGESGDCCRTVEIKMTMSKVQSVTAKFTAHYKLTVSLLG